ncbi:MAG: hypothetical protein K8R10_07100 [Rhodocyclales bacterium]|nr:hypothetical protein [Rhodocyclales bacterium]
MKSMKEAMMEVQGARLGYRLAFRPVEADPPAQDVRLIPVFPEVRPDIGEKTEIVWDLPQLCESIRRPGGYDVVNCACGLGDHSNLMCPTFVAHPDDDTVVWEIDIPGHRPALDARWQETEGFLRLVFRREDYEADIRAMLDAVVNAGTPELPIDDYDPNLGGCVFESLQELAAKNEWSRQPILRSGTVVEFRVAYRDFMLFNGKPSHTYAPRLFTRWAASAAFDRWMDHFLRARDLEESHRAECDQAGEAFAAVLRRCFAEDQTAPGVTVDYRPSQAPAAVL